MKNTHYNLIDTINFLYGRDRFTNDYNDFMNNFYKPMMQRQGFVWVEDLITAFQDARAIPRPVAATLIDCFLWISKGIHEGGGQGYGIDKS